MKTIAVPARTILWFMLRGAELKTRFHAPVGWQSAVYSTVLSYPRAGSIQVQYSAVRALENHKSIYRVRWSGFIEWKVDWKRFPVEWMEREFYSRPHPFGSEPQLLVAEPWAWKRLKGLGVLVETGHNKGYVKMEVFGAKDIPIMTNDVLPLDGEGIYIIHFDERWPKKDES